MPQIAYGSNAYRRANGNLPELRLINMFLERAPNEENGAVLLSRKGLSSHSSVGNGPVTGVYCEENVFSGDVFSVSDGKLYRGTTLVGSIGGTGPVSFAAGASNELAVCAGAGIYRYDGSTLDLVSFPDSANVTSIEFHDGLYLAVRAGTHTLYFSAVLDADTWGALDFFSAESRPDTLRDVRVIGDTLIALGAETIEYWSNTGNADAPYSRIEGRVVPKGAIATGCTVELDNSILFVGSDGMVYRLSDVPQRISDHAIEERIAESSTYRAFGFVSEGHSFYCLRLDAGTWAYDISTGQWCEFQSYGRDNFRAQCAVMSGTTVILGDDEAGTLWTFDGWEDGSDPLIRLFTVAFAIRGGTATIDNLQIEANVGWTELLTGQGSAPVAELRTSRDAGATWGNWRSTNLGAQGAYRTKVQWRRLGLFDFPGGMGEVRCSDPVPFRISGVSVNEPGGGRSR